MDGFKEKFPKFTEELKRKYQKKVDKLDTKTVLEVSWAYEKMIMKHCREN